MDPTSIDHDLALQGDAGEEDCDQDDFFGMSNSPINLTLVMSPSATSTLVLRVQQLRVPRVPSREAGPTPLMCGPTLRSCSRWRTTRRSGMPQSLISLRKSYLLV
uniref:Uncharacterized protein n=1 Tax=Arundo donax TaxID=35708 RepID=A0A0A9GXV2_ARUDO